MFAEYCYRGTAKIIEDGSDYDKVSIAQASLITALGLIITKRPKVWSRRQVYRTIIKQLDIAENAGGVYPSPEKEEEINRRYASEDVVDELLMRLFKSPDNRIAKSRRKNRKDGPSSYEEVLDTMTILIDREGLDGFEVVLNLVSHGFNKCIEARPPGMSQAEAYRDDAQEISQ